MKITQNAEILYQEYKFLRSTRKTEGFEVPQLDIYSSEFSLKCAIEDLKTLPEKTDEEIAVKMQEAKSQEIARREYRNSVKNEKLAKETAIFESLNKGDEAFYLKHNKVIIISKNKNTMKITAKKEDGSKITDKAKWFSI